MMHFRHQTWRGTVYFLVVTFGHGSHLTRTPRTKAKATQGGLPCIASVGVRAASCQNVLYSAARAAV